MIYSRKTCLYLMLLTACTIGVVAPAYDQTTTTAAYSTSTVNPSSGNAPVPTATAPAATPVRYSSGFSFSTSGDRITEPVLVVPAKDADAETTKQIIEDLSIMGRIIEKNSLNSLASISTDSLPLLGQLRLAREGAGPAVLFSSTGRPKPLYVAGYGAVFFIRVNFPLLPPPEAGEKSAAEEPGDAVWAQARQSLLEPPAARTLSGRGREVHEPYSRERVDTLKSTLTATMKHATNIRALEPREWLAIVVQGTSYQTDERTTDPLGTVSSQTADSRGVLTLRATKADVDLYAKGEITQAQFEQRVQSISY